MQLREQLKQAVDPILAKSPNAKVLLLSCVDLRYPHRIIDTMDSLNYRGRYYHLAMAGASHATRHSGEWKKAFEDHLEFAVTEGHVGGVVILDHLDCKAFQLYERTQPGDIPGETAKHIEVAKYAVDLILKLQPSLAGNIHALLLPMEAPEVVPQPIGNG